MHFNRSRLPDLKFQTKTFIFSIAIFIAIASASYYTAHLLKNSRVEILRTAENHTQASVDKLKIFAQQTLDSLYRSGVFNKSELSSFEIRKIDSLLIRISEMVFSGYEGVEGGIYLPKFDLFVGFSFPTAAKPGPAYGPPPREYNIIKEQAGQSVLQNGRLSKIIELEPTVFPLVTDRIIINRHRVAAVWAMMRVENILPAKRLNNLLGAVTLIALAGIVIAIIVSLILRKRVEQIKRGLELMNYNSGFRFKPQRGLLGSISSAINEWADARQKDQELKIALENELRKNEKMAALGNVIARFAHEVKTPLTILKTRVQMIERKLGTSRKEPFHNDEFLTESLRMIVSEIDRLDDLLRKLLVFSKPNIQKKQPVNINHILRQALILIQDTADQRGIEVYTETDGSIPVISADPQSLEQVFLNLLTNAIDAIKRTGSIHIVSAFDKQNGLITISFRDSGPGITEDIAAKIFDPFFTTKESGVGLGLTISYEILRAHGGTISYVPGLNGGGAYFAIKIPITNGEE